MFSLFSDVGKVVLLTTAPIVLVAVVTAVSANVVVVIMVNVAVETNQISDKRVPIGLKVPQDSNKGMITISNQYEYYERFLCGSDV